MEQITKGHINSFKIPKKIMNFLKCEEKDLVRWEINENTQEIKLSCVKSKNHPNKKTDKFYTEENNKILYRRLYKNGSTSFPVPIQNHLKFKKGNLIKWTTKEENKVKIENIERKRLIDLSGITG